MGTHPKSNSSSSLWVLEKIITIIHFQIPLVIIRILLLFLFKQGLPTRIRREKNQNLRKKLFFTRIIIHFNLNHRVYVKTKTLKKLLLQQLQDLQLLVQSPQRNNLNLIANWKSLRSSLMKVNLLQCINKINNHLHHLKLILNL